MTLITVSIDEVTPMQITLAPAVEAAIPALSALVGARVAGQTSVARA